MMSKNNKDWIPANPLETISFPTLGLILFVSYTARAGCVKTI